MDEYLNLILNWFSNLDIKNIDQDKLKRQLSIITSWFKHNAIGYFTASTGFGKTMVAIIAIHRLNLKYPDATTIVIVPKVPLQTDWNNHIRNFDLKNVKVYVVNTYTSTFKETRNRFQCTLLICDEVHHYLSEKGIQFNLTIKCTDFKMFLGMSATLEENEQNILQKMNIPLIDNVSMSEGLRFNYISNFEVYNYGIDINSEERTAYERINDIHNSNFGKFLYFVESEKNWELIRACKGANDSNALIGQDWKTCNEWRKWYAETMDWDGTKEHPWSPTNINKYANQWDWAMRERKEFLHKHNSKLEATKRIIEHLNVPTITFSENTSFADELVSLIGKKALAYHTNIKTGFEIVPVVQRRKTLKTAKKLRLENNGILTVDQETKEYIITFNKEKKISGASLKRQAIAKFESGEIQVLSTAKALDEGFNVEGIGCAIICSGSSKKRQYIQRMGRSLRFIEGKTAKIINIYIKNTQDESWLKRRQKGDAGIIWIEKIEDIKL